MEIKEIVFKNFNIGKPGWSDRKDFVCEEYTLNYADDKNFIDNIINKADDPTNVYSVLARFNEAIALYFFKEISEDENCRVVGFNSKFAQTDLVMRGNVKVEVRSSFAYGFPNVPLFKINKDPQFEGHGTYNLTCEYRRKPIDPNDPLKKVSQRGVRTNENVKDIYTQIMIASSRETFLDDIKKEIKIYVTGSATQKEVADYGGFVKYSSEKVTTKDLNTSTKQVPIHKSRDIFELRELFEV